MPFGNEVNMKTIKLIDMTLAAAGSGISFKEKLETARTVDHMKADAISLPPIGGSKADTLANKTIASMVKAEISAAVNICSGLTEQTWESVRSAHRPSLNLLCPVSTVQMEYSCHKKAPAMLEAVKEEVAKCRFYSEIVEFTAVDATRAEPEFLAAAVNAAIEAGAARITLCDTAGIFLPDEFKSFIEDLRKAAPALENAELYVQPSDDMGMAAACAAAAISAGAAGVKCTAVPAGLPTFEQMSLLVAKKGAALDIDSSIHTTDLSRSAAQIANILSRKEEKESPTAGLSMGDISEVTLDAGDDISEVIKVINRMGYDLSEEDYAKVYEEFRRVSGKKHYVGTKELDAIIAASAMQVPSSYRLDNFVINSGNIITATANVLLINKDGEKIRGVGTGDGPIDAAFVAIEQIIGHHYELDDFRIKTVTEGRDAMGSALVKLRAEGKVYSGSGISTDIIGASIRAYISALNKIVYDMQ